MAKTRFFRFLIVFPFLLLLFTLFHETRGQGRPGGTELGIILGEPTGISFKTWQSGTTAIDAAAAWSVGRHESVHIHADYLKHDRLEAESGTVYFYYGLGARALFADDPRFGARIPVGLQYIFPNTRLTMFFEVAPLLDLIPATEFGVNGGLGIRYFL